MLPTPVPVNFRETVPGIRDTSYLTHGLFYYPAKFIPHVPNYCIRHFSPEGGWVVDPFAGSGTVGLEAVLSRRNAILLDINPLLEHVVDLKINFRMAEVNEGDLSLRFQDMLASKETFEPRWSRVDYWYPPEVLELLGRYWGWVHQNPGDPYAEILQSSLLRASRRFSWAEHRVPKLFRSRRKLREMEEMLQGDWQRLFHGYLWERSRDTMHRAQALARLLRDHPSQAIALAGVDSASADLGDMPEVDLVLTSPPYLQAQEYIRTFKLDLFWLGYSEESIRELTKLEIPYRKAPLEFYSPSYLEVYRKLERRDLKEMLNSYFYYTTLALQNAARRLKRGGYLCVFVGNPRVDGVPVQTWRIIGEWFMERGFAPQGVYEDAIKSRQLFRRRRNKNPDGIPSEYLLVMRKLF